MKILKPIATISVIMFLAGFALGIYITKKNLKPKTLIIPYPEPIKGGSGLLKPEKKFKNSIHLPSGYAGRDTLTWDWFGYQDRYLNIKVHAVRADTVKYTFQKRWYPFPRKKAHVSVFGVAPDSVKISFKEPDKKKFSFIFTLTTRPSWNILLGYKNFIFQIESPFRLHAGKFNYGIGFKYEY
jgi:hypothetical protein